MNKMLKVMAISVVTALFLALPLMAQVTGTREGSAPDPTSNQRGATATLYKNDVDNYLSVNNYSTVNFEKWFGFVHGGSNAYFPINVGFSTNLGALYLGVRYTGRVFYEQENNKRVTLTPAYDSPDYNYQELTSLTTRTTNPDKWQDSDNQLDLLIGVANQGIRVGFYESMAVNAREAGRDLEKTDNQHGLITITGAQKEYSQFGGWMRPSLQWGTLLAVGGMTIKPRVGAALGIYQNELIDDYYSQYSTFNGELITNKDLIRGAGNNNGLLRPQFKIGADIGLPKKDTLAMTATIDYTFELDIYDNDYSASGFSGTAKGPVSWTNNYTGGAPLEADYGYTVSYTAPAGESTSTKARLTFNDQTRFYHNIVPQFTVDKSVAEGLNVGFKITAPTSITVSTTDQYTEEKTYTETTEFNPENPDRAKTITETTLHTPNAGTYGGVANTAGLTETTVFTIAPTLNVGAKYALIPNRFSVNAGIRFNPLSYNNTLTNVSRNGTGARTTSTTKQGSADAKSKDMVTTEKEDITDMQSFSDISTVSHTWNYLNGEAGGGFVFNFNENAALDLWASGGAFQGTWNVNLTTVNVMLIVKF
jgi:hypothetical protein